MPCGPGEPSSERRVGRGRGGALAGFLEEESQEMQGMAAPVGVGDIPDNDEHGEDGDPSLLPKEEQVFEDCVPGFEEDGAINAILRRKKESLVGGLGWWELGI